MGRRADASRDEPDALFSFSESISAYTTCPLQIVLRLAPLRSFFYLASRFVPLKVLTSRFVRLASSSHHPRGRFSR